MHIIEDNIQRLVSHNPYLTFELSRGLTQGVIQDNLQIIHRSWTYVYI